MFQRLERGLLHRARLSRFAIAVIVGDVDLGELHGLHDGLDCTTFTDIAKSSHHRHSWNAYSGQSKDSYYTNLRQNYLYALHLFQASRGDPSKQLLVVSMENPKATRQFHPLTINVPQRRLHPHGAWPLPPHCRHYFSQSLAHVDCE